SWPASARSCGWASGPSGRTPRATPVTRSPRSATSAVRDRGAGLISSAAGVLVFLLFLTMAVQLLYGLYAASTVTAVANDAAQRAAEAGAPPVAQVEADARALLGRIGDTATFEWSLDDADGDGL